MTFVKQAAFVLAALTLSACATAPQSAPYLKAADHAPLLADPARTQADKNDDAARRPAEVLEFAQLRSGETILELEAGRGWYTEILSAALGPAGRVIAQNPAEFTFATPDMAARRGAGRFPNVTETLSHFDKLAVPDASVDRVLWILGPHEVYFVPRGFTEMLGDPKTSYAEVMRVLKPGGAFVVMDHAADAGAPTTTGGTIHRIDPALVLGFAKEAGFQLEATNDMLANPTDDRTKNVFDNTVRRHTDQFLFRFRKAN